MNDVFEDLGKKIGETAEAVTNKASEIIELQKIKNQMNTLRKSNSRDFTDLGKMVYAKYKTGGTIDADSMALCEAISERIAKISEFEMSAADVRGAVTCPACKKHVEKGMVYCPYCGDKVPADAWKTEVHEKVKEKAEDIKAKAADVKEDIKAKAADVKDAVKDVAADAKDIANEAAADVKDAMNDAKDAVNHVAEDMEDAASEETTKRSE